MKEGTGFAVQCDFHGNIIKILRNDSHLSIYDGQSLHQVIEKSSLSKFQEFLLEIKKQQASFNWEINLRDSPAINTFYFSGSRIHDNLFLAAGAVSARRASYDFYEELMRINNEQINLLRTALKNQTLQNFKKTDVGDIYNEISALNNELVNAQRELARKKSALDDTNAQLKQTIVELEQTRDSLALSNQQLNDLDHEKDRFLGMVAHDLRNPLGVIKSVSDVLLEGNEDEDQVEFIRMLQDASSQTLTLVNDLLNIVKVQRAVIDLEYEELVLAPFIHRIAKNQRLLASAKNIALTVEIADDAPKTVYCDPHRIEQVLINLLGNAIKFSYHHSEIVLRVKDAAGKTEISIVDSGQGIAPEEQDKIFGEFQQASSKAIASEEGFGLGLVICKKIIELHQGKIGVESSLGAGCRFYFIL